MPKPTPVQPEVLAQIRQLEVSGRPLIICDVDEVILHMISHLEDYLDTYGLMFLNDEFRLTGNIAPKDSRTPLSSVTVRNHLLLFFEEYCDRQDMVPGANEALAKLAGDWDIVLLTNLPGSHNKPVREKLLAGFDISYPLVTNSGPKGGAVAALAARRPSPVVFIDDSPANHSSVSASFPSAVQIQFIADPRFRNAMKKESHIDLLTGNWQETETYISAILDG
ncbi:hypothetical protein [Roseibium aggregatum]|uniref:Uncharacterized protein n=1 Tax=Roseibium aggregatum TaxID=187304 RepID=A0A939J318_9HYPH|nr:hypothetical protein [Roseibium aggregatum]MBN9670107.1 hypothetical protein [Roseibium aggregatum]